MATHILIACALISVFFVVTEGHNYLEPQDAKFIDGLGSFFWYPYIAGKQYAAVSLNEGGNTQWNGLHPCFKTENLGRTYIDKRKMFNVTNTEPGMNYWVRLRAFNPVRHAEQQIFDKLDDLVQNLGHVKTIHLFTRLSPCWRCTDLIRTFAQANQHIHVHVGYRVVYEHRRDPRSGAAGLTHAKQRLGPLQNVFFAQIDEHNPPQYIHCATGENDIWH